MAKYNYIPEISESGELFTDIAQIGIVVRDLNKVVGFMKDIFHAEEPPIVHAKPYNGFYKGKPAEYTADIAYYECFRRRSC